MIPKIIHYCWFGGSKLPENAIKCIDSWRKYLPDYEIKEWNEDNFNIECCDYVKEAYYSKKWAFVSDYARFWILYNYGGLYFDTDVEIIAPLDDLIEQSPYMGCEKDFSPDMVIGNYIAINSGLGLALNPGMSIIKELLDQYENDHFLKDNGSFDLENNVVSRVTKKFSEYGFDNSKSEIQFICGIKLYPTDYFCPKNYYTNELNITKNTRSIHHYSATWLNENEKKIEIINAKFSKSKVSRKIGRLISLPFVLRNKIESVGIKKTGKIIFNKIFKKVNKV